MLDTRLARRAAPALAALVVLIAVVLAGHLPLAAQAPARQARPAVGAPAAVPAGIADAAFRLEAWDRFVSMRGSSPFKEMKWQHLGPTNISGRVVDVDVAVRKGKTRVIYVASASGGLWKTENEGVTFEPIFEQAASIQGGDVTVAPSNPNIIWYGTGEANLFRSSNAGVGVFKSVDAGKSWQHMGLPSTHTIPRIVIHPTNPDVVYVAAGGREWTDNEERGIYKTADGGKTWSKVLYVDARTGGNDLVMDPADPNVLYATTWQRVRQKWNDPRTLAGYTGSGIHKTTDGGRTWAPINEGLPAPDKRGRIGIDVARSNPNVLYAFVDNYEIARQAKPGEMDAYGRQRQGTIKGAEIYRSDNRGQAWKKVSESNSFMEGSAGTYGWVFAQIRVDPNNENVVYFLGLGLNQSTDGGKTYRSLRGMHGDHHALWIDPSNSDTLVNGNDGGVVISYDFGRTWRQFLDNLPVVTFFNVEFDNGAPLRVYGSVQDHGSYRAVVDLSRGRDRIPTQAFQGTIGGEGSTHAIDTSDNNTVYASSFYGNLSRADLSQPPPAAAGGRQRAYASTNVMPKAAAGEPSLRGQWMAPTIVSPHDPKVVYHGLQYVFRSVNKGDTWERISPDLTGNDPKMFGDIPYQTLFALAESPLRAGLLYAGTDDGRLHVTRDGGKTWTELTANLPQRKWISRVVPSAFDEGTVYVTQNGKRDDEFAAYVYKSTDFGKTFRSLVGNIPGGPVNVIREDPADAKTLYVGTDMGVFVSQDGGAIWNVLGGNLPQVFALDLVVQPRDRLIAIATHGRGIWIMDAAALAGKK